MHIPDEKIDEIRARYYKMSRKRDAKRRRAKHAQEEGNAYTAKFERDVARRCNDIAIELSGVIETLGIGYGDEKDYQYTQTA